ncbi:MAG: hypothetical protein ACREX4_23875 [Gammaproteobacteria bacterium]
MEHWFRTLRAQLLTRLTPEDTRSLEALNRRLWAWVEGEYHHTPHRSLEGQTPLERWASRADERHFPDWTSTRSSSSRPSAPSRKTAR